MNVSRDSFELGEQSRLIAIQQVIKLAPESIPLSHPKVCRGRSIDRDLKCNCYHY